MSPTRVFIMASSPLVRAGLRSMLAETEPSPDLEVVGEGTHTAIPGGPEQSLELSEAEVILVAGEEPLEEEFEASLGAEDRALVLLSEDESVVFRLRALPLSGWAVVPPDASSEELAAAIVAAANGLVVLPKVLSERLFDEESPAFEEPPETLTRREEEVLELLSRGLPNKGIARELSISEHTVKFHVSSLYAKLGVGSRAEAVGVGARLGLITL